MSGGPATRMPRALFEAVVWQNANALNSPFKADRDLAMASVMEAFDLAVWARRHHRTVIDVTDEAEFIRERAQAAYRDWPHVTSARRHSLEAAVEASRSRVPADWQPEPDAEAAAA